MRSKGRLCPMDRAQVASCTLAPSVWCPPVLAVGLQRENEPTIERLHTIWLWPYYGLCCWACGGPAWPLAAVLREGQQGVRCPSCQHLYKGQSGTLTTILNSPSPSSHAKIMLFIYCVPLPPSTNLLCLCQQASSPLTPSLFGLPVSRQEPRKVHVICFSSTVLLPTLWLPCLATEVKVAHPLRSMALCVFIGTQESLHARHIHYPLREGGPWGY